MGNDTKIDRYTDTQGLAAFLRGLADAVEQGGGDEYACVNDFKKMKISVKREFGQIALKAKFKSASQCSAEEGGVEAVPGGLPRYKSLKKRMKESFKIIFTMIHDGTMPPDEAVLSFLADSALMVTYPGYGDEFYPAYTEACRAFEAAYKAGDMARLNETVDALAHQKGHCHAKYD
jgi:XXXCH domain-containing protein